MRADEIIALQRKQPFTGLRIQMSDGSTHEISDALKMLVARSCVHIALPPSKNGVPQRWTYCDPVHITQIEPIDRSTSGRRGRRRKS